MRLSLLASKFLRVFRRGEAYSILSITDLQENINKPLQRRTEILTVLVGLQEKIYIPYDYEIKLRIQNYFLDLWWNRYELQDCHIVIMYNYQYLPRKNDSSFISFYFNIVCLFFWRDGPLWARTSSFTRFLDHLQRRNTVSRTPLDEWSARRRDLYLTTHNTHSMPPVGYEPTISAGERPQTYALDRAATGSGNFTIVSSVITVYGI